MKFKVGDKVRRIKYDHYYGPKVGDIGIITEIRDDDSVWIGDINHHMDFLELVEDVQANALKHGDIVYISDHDPECKEKDERILSSVGHENDEYRFKVVMHSNENNYRNSEKYDTAPYKYCIKKVIEEPVMVDIVSDGKVIGRIRKDSIGLGGE